MKKGPKFDLSDDVLAHPTFLKLKQGQQLRLLKLCAWCWQFCEAGVMWLYDDEIAQKMNNLSLEHWQELMQVFLDRKCFFKVTTERGFRRYEAATWLIPTYEGDTRRPHVWEDESGDCEEMQVQTGKKGGRQRIYVDNAEKQAYQRYKERFEKLGLTIPTLEEFRRTRIYPADTLEGLETDTIDPEKNSDNNRNGIGLEIPTTSSSISSSSLIYKEEGLLNSATADTRHETSEKKFAGNRTANQVIEEMLALGVHKNTIEKEFMPKGLLAECARQLDYLPYSNAKDPRGYFCSAVRLPYAAPPGYQAAQQKLKEDALQERQQRERENAQRAASEAKEAEEARVSLWIATATEEEKTELERAARAEVQQRGDAVAKRVPVEPSAALSVVQEELVGPIRRRRILARLEPNAGNLAAEEQSENADKGTGSEKSGSGAA